MRIRNVLHKGLRRFIEDDDKSGIRAAVAEKLRRMISFLQDMEKETELKTVSGWKAHRLTGDRKGTWSLSVTKNWRLTFGSTRPKSRLSILITRTITRRWP
jgi:proteic killer suppression protein